MKHASPATLDGIEPLLKSIRGLGLLHERRPGIFYLKSAAYLHFHEDPAGLFADVKLAGAWMRMDVTSPRARKSLVTTVKRDLS